MSQVPPDGVDIYAPPAIATTQAPRHPARRWVAFLLSVAAPGAGQFYFGRVRRAVALLAAVTLGPLVMGIALRPATRAGLYVPAMVLFGIAALARPVAALDTLWIRPRPEDRRPAARIVLLGAIVSLVLTLAARRVANAFLLEAYNIASGAMAPTLLRNDHVFVDKTATRAHRGQLVLFPMPELPTEPIIKRVVALAGDRLEMRDGTPWINDWEVPHCFVGQVSFEDDGQAFEGDVAVEYLEGAAYLLFRDAGQTRRAQEGPWLVPPGEVFVLGDNRENSHDSRRWYGEKGGGLPLANIGGEPFVLWLSVSPTTGTLDLSRMGKSWDAPMLPTAFAALQVPLDRCLVTRPAPEATVPPSPSTPSPRNAR